MSFIILDAAGHRLATHAAPERAAPPTRTASGGSFGAMAS